MFDLPAALKGSEAWARLSSLASSGRFPQCVAIVAPEEVHSALAVGVAHKILCLNGQGEDDCPACRGWSGDEHPDFIKGGEPGKAPAISSCREIIKAMTYRPVVSQKRCGVIFSADRMLLPAANSLLKLAEEPPDYGVIFFLLEDEGRLLPTLKSRAWVISLNLDQQGEKRLPPASAVEWSKWVEKNASSETDQIIAQFHPWIRALLESGDFTSAGRIEGLRLLLESGRLSKTMALDLTVLALKEGIVFEHLFGDFW